MARNRRPCLTSASLNRRTPFGPMPCHDATDDSVYCARANARVRERAQRRTRQARRKCLGVWMRRCGLRDHELARLLVGLPHLGSGLTKIAH